MFVFCFFTSFAYFQYSSQNFAIFFSYTFLFNVRHRAHCFDMTACLVCLYTSSRYPITVTSFAILRNNCVKYRGLHSPYTVLLWHKTVLPNGKRCFLDFVFLIKIRNRIRGDHSVLIYAAGELCASVRL